MLCSGVQYNTLHFHITPRNIWFPKYFNFFVGTIKLHVSKHVFILSKSTLHFCCKHGIECYIMFSVTFDFSSFFQSVCVLGYCILPMVISLIIARVILAFDTGTKVSTALFVLRLLTVIVAFGWSTFGKFLFTNCNVIFFQNLF